jgi:hypothetical protein
MAALSHLLPWGEFKTYTVILSHADPESLRARVNQSEIREAAGCSLRTVRNHIARFRDLDLIRVWRGPEGANYYRFNLPLPDKVVEAIRARITEFGIEPVRPRARKRPSLMHVPATVATTALDVDTEPAAEPLENLHSGQAACTAGSQPCTSQENQTITEQTGLESPDELVSDNIPESPEPPGLLLDPEISIALDDLERRSGRNTTVRFLEFLGYVGPPLASDQRIIIDRDGLLAYLLEQEANSVSCFCELVQDFATSPPDDLPPAIDLPMSTPISMYMHRELEGHFRGKQWLEQFVPRKDPDGGLLSDDEIRRSMLEFMKQNGLHSLDDVIALAVEKDKEVVKKPNVRPLFAGEPPVELRPGELSCNAILENFVNNEASWQEEVDVCEDEMSLVAHCLAKFDREHAHIGDSVVKARQRGVIVNALVIVGRQNPAVVGYQPEAGDVNEIKT